MKSKNKNSNKGPLNFIYINNNFSDSFITPSTRVPPSAFLKNESHNPQATGQNKSENCGPATRSIDSADVGRIKGIG